MKKLEIYKDGSTKNAEEYLESLGKTSYHILNKYNFNDNFGPVNTTGYYIVRIGNYYIDTAQQRCV